MSSAIHHQQVLQYSESQCFSVKVYWFCDCPEAAENQEDAVTESSEWWEWDIKSQNICEDDCEKEKAQQSKEDEIRDY